MNNINIADHLCPHYLYPQRKCREESQAINPAHLRKGDKVKVSDDEPGEVIGTVEAVEPNLWGESEVYISLRTVNGRRITLRERKGAVKPRSWEIIKKALRLPDGPGDWIVSTNNDLPVVWARVEREVDGEQFMAHLNHSTVLTIEEFANEYPNWKRIDQEVNLAL